MGQAGMTPSLGQYLGDRSFLAIRGRSAGGRNAVRQEKSEPLVLALKAWLEQGAQIVSSASPCVNDGCANVSS
jgi:hypothetical protein